jgi:hypothetical protein
MRGSILNSSRSYLASPTATYKVKFGKGNGDSSGNGKAVPSGRIPRVTSLLALAHRIEEMIRIGELKDWAEAARLIGVTRARMTHIANLLLLAPELQEMILFPQKKERITRERELRSVFRHPLWQDQKELVNTGDQFPS